MKEYIVYRRGLGGGKQDEAEKPVLRLQAKNSEEACRLAVQQVSVAAGQTLFAVRADALDTKENDLNRRADAL